MALKDGLYYVEDVVRGQWGSGERERIIRQVAEADGKAVRIYIEQEPGSSGVDSVRTSIMGLGGYVVEADKVTGDKITRANPTAAQAQAGNVKLVRGPWNEAYVRELHAFPTKVCRTTKWTPRAGHSPSCHCGASSSWGGWGRRRDAGFT